MGVQLGIDIGGTFTDLVGHGPDGQWYHAKVPSTRSDPVACVLAAIEAAAISPADVDSVALATTIGTNALLERRGARVAYLATEGFEDQFPVCADPKAHGFNTAPHLDFALRYKDGSRVGIECKLFEPYGRIEHALLRPASPNGPGRSEPNVRAK